MSKTDHVYDVTPRVDDTDWRVQITPTTPAAHTWATRLITELSADVALAARITGAAAGSTDPDVRGGTVARLAVMLQRAATEIVGHEGAQKLADELYEAAATPLTCEHDGCTNYVMHHDICRTHFEEHTARLEASIAAYWGVAS